MRNIFKIDLLKKVLVLASCIIAISTLGRTTWKGFDLTRLTDAFDFGIPVGTSYLEVSKYTAKESFGQVIPTGDPISTNCYILDKHGFITKGPKYTYVNTYDSDGRVKQRDMYEGNKLDQRLIYEYFVDAKGPGVNVKTYDSNGEKYSFESWQNNSYIFIKPGYHITAKLNKNGQSIEKTITITNYNQSVTVYESDIYNSHGCLEVSTVKGPGFNKITGYTNYVYDKTGSWIERFSKNELTKRKIFSNEEYEEYLKEQKAAEELKKVEEERKKAEEERKKAEEKRKKIEEQNREKARKVALEKQTIKSSGYVKGSSLASLPNGTVEISELYPPSSKDFSIILPENPNVVSFENVLKVDLKKSAQYKFANDSIGNVPSQFIGTITSEWVVNEKFEKPIEIKIEFKNQENEWIVKDAHKLSSKYHLSTEVVEALSKYISELGRKKSFNTKKIYLSSITQLKVSVVSAYNSALFYYDTKTFPIVFQISETKK